jgi:hypothetical protein
MENKQEEESVIIKISNLITDQEARALVMDVNKDYLNNLYANLRKCIEQTDYRITGRFHIFDKRHTYDINGNRNDNS